MRTLDVETLLPHAHALARATGDDRVHVVIEAIRALRTLGPRAAPHVDAVSSLLDHHSVDVRYFAALFIGECAGEDSARHARRLSALLTDPSAHARRASLTAIGLLRRSAATHLRHVAPELLPAATQWPDECVGNGYAAGTATAGPCVQLGGKAIGSRVVIEALGLGDSSSSDSGDGAKKATTASRSNNSGAATVADEKRRARAHELTSLLPLTARRQLAAELAEISRDRAADVASAALLALSDLGSRAAPFAGYRRWRDSGEIVARSREIFTAPFAGYAPPRTAYNE